MNTLKKTISTAMPRLCVRAVQWANTAKEKLRSQEGQILVDHSIWVLIIIVFGGVVLVFGKDFLTNTLMPTVGEKIMSFMN